MQKGGAFQRLNSCVNSTEITKKVSMKGVVLTSSVLSTRPHLKSIEKEVRKEERERERGVNPETGFRLMDKKRR